jgi:transposase
MNNPTNSDGYEIRVQRPERGQTIMHMLTLDEMIPADAQVRSVWKYVSSLDLSGFYQDIQAVIGGAGRDPADPKMLLALWLFATIEGVGSARQLAVKCTRDFAYMWICGSVGVNRDMLNSFRTKNSEALDAIMVETIGILLNNDLVSLDCVAQDGMRVRASAGKSSFRRKATLEEHLKEAQKQVEETRQENIDENSGRSRQQAARERAARERKERIENAIEEREKLHQQKEKREKGTGEKARCSTTEPEARNMKMPDGGYRPAHNVQFATTTGSRIIVGVGVTNEGTDSGQMEPMLDQIETNFGRRPGKIIADGGYNSREDITAIEKRGTEVYAPIKKEKVLLEDGKDPYQRRKGDTDENYQWRQRMKTDEAKEIYKERCSTAEFPNAGCRNRGLQQFPVRGLPKVRTIAVWQAVAHNFKMILCHGWLPTLVKG